MLVFFPIEMPRKESQNKKATVVIPAEEMVLKRGRKMKYQSEEERREARREQNRKYRERKKAELISLRRAAAKGEPDKNNECHEDVDAVPVDL